MTRYTEYLGPKISKCPKRPASSELFIHLCLRSRCSTRMISSHQFDLKNSAMFSPQSANHVVSLPRAKNYFEVNLSKFRPTVFPVYSRKCKSQGTKIIRYRDHMKILGTCRAVWRQSMYWSRLAKQVWQRVYCTYISLQCTL